MNGRYRGRKRRNNIIPYLIGMIILVAAIVISIKGLASGAVAPSPTSKPAASPTATPNSNYTTVIKQQDEMYQGKLILVNGDHPYKFLSSEKLVNIYDYKTSSYKVTYTDIQAGNSIISPMNAMFDAFYSAAGINNVYVISGYRSLERQQELFKQEVAEVGETEAPKWVAVPGTSEHHTGLAVDLGQLGSDGSVTEFDGSGKYSWIGANSYKYGFVIRYSDSKRDITKIYREPWHLRYIGIPHATEITRLGFCLEEYINYLRSYSYNNPLEIKTDDGGVYNTYFCTGLTVYIPKSGSYEISGNNVDGFIVTVKVS